MRSYSLSLMLPVTRNCAWRFHLSGPPAVLDAGADLDEHMFALREYTFTITEHDPDRPWIVRGHDRHTVTLEDGVEFFAWAGEQWPAPRWSVQLDPWQLTPKWPR